MCNIVTPENSSAIDRAPGARSKSVEFSGVTIMVSSATTQMCARSCGDIVAPFGTPDARTPGVVDITYISSRCITVAGSRVPYSVHPLVIISNMVYGTD